MNFSKSTAVALFSVAAAGCSLKHETPNYCAYDAQTNEAQVIRRGKAYAAGKDFQLVSEGLLATKSVASEGALFRASALVINQKKGYCTLRFPNEDGLMVIPETYALAAAPGRQ